MLTHIAIENVLFVDIETVPAQPLFSDLSPAFQELWAKKAESLKKEAGEMPADLYKRAGIYAEFGKVICISAGFMKEQGSTRQLRLKSFCGEDEKEVLSEFMKLLNSYFSRRDRFLCAHNGREFDFPYLARRILINNLPLPPALDVSGRKPWESPFLDTMELWKFGDYKSYTSLQLLAAVFDIPTPKDDIDGSDVWWVFWKQKDLARIAKYCQKDVLTAAQLLLRFKGQPLLKDEEIIFV